MDEIKEKPGFKTSEFWVCIAVVVLGALAASGAFAADHWAIKGIALASSALAAMGYTKQRAAVKLGISAERSSLGKPPAE